MKLTYQTRTAKYYW